MLTTGKQVTQLLETLEQRTRTLPEFFLQVESLVIFDRQNAEKAVRTEKLAA